MNPRPSGTAGRPVQREEFMVVALGEWDEILFFPWDWLVECIPQLWLERQTVNPTDM